MKTIKKLFFLLLFIMLLFLGIDLLYVGKPIDSFNGVSVYHNGVFYLYNRGLHYAGSHKRGYYFGIKWQCVEFVKRYYYKVMQHKMPNVWGHASHFFNNALKHGDFNRDRGLNQYYNGKRVKPKVHDLLVFQNTKYGHVAIICKVSSSYIEVIQQNIWAKSRKRYVLQRIRSRYFVGDRDNGPVGWLRKGQF